MGVVMLPNLGLVVKACAFACFLVLQGFAVSSISPSLSVGPAFPPSGEHTSGNISHGAFRSNAPASASQPNGSVLPSPLALPPPPRMMTSLAPTLRPNAPTSQPPYSSASPPATPPNNPHMRPQDPKHPVTNVEAPVAPPSRQSQQKSPSSHPTFPGSTQPNSPQNAVPVHVPVAPVNAPAPRTAPHNLPPTHLVDPVVPPSILPEPVAPSPQKSPPIHPPVLGSVPPNSHQNKVPVNVPFAPVVNAPAPRTASHNPPPTHLVNPIVPPSTVPEPVAPSPQRSPSIHPPILGSMPPDSHRNKVPVNVPFAPVVNAPAPRTTAHNPPPSQLVKPVLPPSIRPEPVALSPSKFPGNIPPGQPILPNEPPSSSPGKHQAPSISTLPPHINPRRAVKPVAAPLNGIAKSPTNAPSAHKGKGELNTARPPITHPVSAPNTGKHLPASPPSTSFQRHHHHPGDSMTAPAPLVYPVPPHPPIKLAPDHPRPHPRANVGHHVFPPMESERDDSPAPSPSSTSPPGESKMPIPSPEVAPSLSLPRNPKVPFKPPIQALPPPPPNADCASLVCSEPLTNSPPGPLCICVLPIQVGLRLSVSLYTFFPLVSELAAEISVGVFMKQSQVRIMGANAASQDPEKTVVLIDLVPLGEKFDNTTSYLTFQRIWHKKVDIKTSIFGDYQVLYVRYPGLPHSPPSASSDIDAIHNDPYHGRDNSTRTIQPLGVDVRKSGHGRGPNRSIIAITVLSVSVAVIFCCAMAWILLFKNKDCLSQPDSTPSTTIPPLAKPSGVSASMVGSGPSSASMSLGSSIAAYAGSAKTFTSSEIERATDNFSETRVLGEGGFGRVYRGVLDDGTNVAVKILKRDDHQGVREFLAEVEMLSRLHHRNLVKLIGICIDEQTRCLIYELIPNGSVESHLHGVDKETAPLNWAARLKIALGAARGLAYLHEDSSPRVIHRDFKSSNILLEHDFTPKVSDFGLARAALDEENRHISTRVMGTFGYVAPEYAMTGHLLVKSDVYSYGVVLLELLTGRKPIDMSQPPGQENLVSWVRPLLTSKEGLELIIDPYLGPDFPYDSITKVAAIASMCVQPEVSHRPFMGEVVQALKLVCSECDETRELGSRSCSQEDLSIDMDASTKSEHMLHPLSTQSPVSHSHPVPDIERGLSVSEILSSSVNDGRPEYDSLRRHSSSGPLRTSNARQLWQKIRRFSRGNVSEHGVFRLWPGSR